ncbi:MAG TPA: 3-dehydroquinate synthase [Pseudogracilibacillus sp.]|nr:3-dehydroquinate synthase [Pseudogracilibacillus sp.]
MIEMTIQAGRHSYPIYIGEHIRHHLQQFIQKQYSSILVITDDTIAPLYKDDVIAALANEKVYEVVVPSGEKSKSIDTYYSLQTTALENGLDRQSLIIALGGGVIGDLAGFVAATFMRGIDFIQMPTTILAHDSSVGGKVAINHKLGKNMIGNFYPPVAVIYDIATLRTLPKREIRSGYAELMKEAFIGDRELLQELLCTNIIEARPKELAHFLRQGIQVKAKIVEEDEREANVRMFLNFGHTLAHALENKLGYGKLTHGEAVAIGMLFALQYSEAYFDISLPIDRYVHWLHENDYPLSLFNIDLNKLVETMKVDKKVIGGTIKLILLKEIEKPTVIDVDDRELLSRLDDFQKELTRS